MRAVFAIGVLAACGGGPSVTADPSAVISSTQCNMIGSTSLNFNADYQVTLQLGQAFKADVGFLGGPTPQSVNEFYGCVFWDSIAGANGCVRDDADDDVTESITHTLSLGFTEPLQPPISLSVFANVLVGANSTVTIGSNDFDDVPCI